MPSSRRGSAPMSGFIDATLHTRDGALLGVVDELLVALDSGRIEYLLATAANGQRLQFRWDAIEIRDGAFCFHGETADLLVDGAAPEWTRRRS
jgi:uncharacterized protein YrrD